MAEARIALAEQLRERRSPLEKAVLGRVRAISDPAEGADPTYVDGVGQAVSAALTYGIAGIEQGERSLAEVPVALLAQARLAVRNSVGLDTVLRRYQAGYALMADSVIDEAFKCRAPHGANLRVLMRAQAAAFDRLLAAVAEEYRLEERNLRGSAEARLRERIKRLLDGEALEASGLGYDLGGSHIGIAGAGPNAVRAIRELSGAVDAHLLIVQNGESSVWAWLGCREGLDPQELLSKGRHQDREGVALALGEPGEMFAGWTLTHRQALAALPVALRRRGDIVRYADVAMLASALKDDVLRASLHSLYLAPLEQDHDGGERDRETLRAYFAGARNISAAAAALGMNRHTVASRLRSIEERLGWQLQSCATDLEAALNLAELGSFAQGGVSPPVQAPNA
jgi:hypothetical protein